MKSTKVFLMMVLLVTAIFAKINPWLMNTEYEIGEVVEFDGSYYEAVRNPNINSTPNSGWFWEYADTTDETDTVFIYTDTLVIHDTVTIKIGEELNPAPPLPHLMKLTKSGDGVMGYNFYASFTEHYQNSSLSISSYEDTYYLIESTSDNDPILYYQVPFGENVKKLLDDNSGTENSFKAVIHLKGINSVRLYFEHANELELGAYYFNIQEYKTDPNLTQLPYLVIENSVETLEYR